MRVQVKNSSFQVDIELLRAICCERFHVQRNCPPPPSYIASVVLRQEILLLGILQLGNAARHIRQVHGGEVCAPIYLLCCGALSLSLRASRFCSRNACMHRRVLFERCIARLIMAFWYVPRVQKRHEGDEQKKCQMEFPQTVLPCLHEKYVGALLICVFWPSNLMCSKDSSFFIPKKIKLILAEIVSFDLQNIVTALPKMTKFIQIYCLIIQM
jgi:hypothetical protein